MEAFLISTGAVALAEIGDKTQLLAFILAAKFRKPVPIILGILVATLANHGLAGVIGAWLTALIAPDAMRWILGLSFIGMAIWTLIPDKFDEDDAKLARLGVFGATLVAFFLAEMGDKTQVATVALAAHYESIGQSLFAVVLGTTLGMMIANVPAVILGDRIADKVPVRTVHMVAALIFSVLGVAILLGVGDSVALVLD
ncbi:MAG: TMEM165/GDT1 family protein [Gammaproteobacteria bacterium]|nr:TMEM165/GDT1 family protein [Gammaproteobacteria bacterium]MDP2142121.1 TMEM165/GDT1 family protein [Gammaproteobacteria bacterium]MDP2348271.1 TMEM165/GDT1 family protein [Gammaproteobacteria bacterium]